MPKLSDLVARTIPDGAYMVRIEEIEETKTKKGDPQLQFSGVIVEGPMTGRNIRFWRTLGETSIWVFGRDLVNAGAEDVELEFNDVGAAMELANNTLRNQVFEMSTIIKPFGENRRGNEWHIIPQNGRANV